VLSVRCLDLLLRNSKHQSWRRLLSDNVLTVEEAVDEIIRTNHPGNEKISSSVLFYLFHYNRTP